MKNRLPSWFKQEIPDERTWKMQHLIAEFGVHTVCQEAKCPNINYCFKNNQVTFLILGDICTRNCRFCNIGMVLESKQECPPARDTSSSSSEPSLISEVVRRLGLRYVVITSVSRDDLCDGGAAVFAKTIELIRQLDKGVNPVRDTANSSNNSKVSNGVKVEVLIPDFHGKISSIKTVLDAGPDVIGHNIETVKRLYSELRPMADYHLSLGLLTGIKELRPEIITKSSLMLGLGEREEEVSQTMKDLRQSECDVLTLGQYLPPSPQHYPLKEFISPAQFKKYREIALSLGFKSVLSGPLVRSSYARMQGG